MAQLAVVPVGMPSSHEQAAHGELDTTTLPASAAEWKAAPSSRGKTRDMSHVWSNSKRLSMSPPGSSYPPLSGSAFHAQNLHVDGSVSLPSMAKAMIVLLVVFNVFGNALVFCVLTFLSYFLLLEYGSRATDRADALELEQLERRWQRGALGFDDTSRYIMRKLGQVYERVVALSHGAIEYSVTLSIDQAIEEREKEASCNATMEDDEQWTHWTHQDPLALLDDKESGTQEEEEEFLHYIGNDLFAPGDDIETRHLSECTTIKACTLMQDDAPASKPVVVDVPTFSSPTVTTPSIRKMLEEVDKMMADMAVLLPGDDFLKALNDDERPASENFDETRLLRSRSSVRFSDEVTSYDRPSYEGVDFEDECAHLYHGGDELDAMQADFFSQSIPEDEL